MLCVLLGMSLAHAEPLDTLDPQQWLQSMASAFKEKTYEGRFFYSNGRQIRSLQIFHSNENGVERERLLHLSGDPAEVIRIGDEISCYHPNNKMTQLKNTFNALPTGPFGRKFNDVSLMLEQYELEMRGIDRVADREAVRINLIPKDANRYGYFLWLDKSSSLLLKSLLVDDRGVPLEVFEFVQLSVDISIPETAFEPKSKLTRVAVSETKKPEPLSEVPQLPDDWEVGVPKGFMRSANDLRRVGMTDSEKLISRIYTDGVSAFSVFFERTDDKSLAPPATRQGATVAVSKIVEKPESESGQQYILTVVGEVPIDTGKQVVDSFRWKP